MRLSPQARPDRIWIHLLFLAFSCSAADQGIGDCGILIASASADVSLGADLDRIVEGPLLYLNGGNSAKHPEWDTHLRWGAYREAPAILSRGHAHP